MENKMKEGIKFFKLMVISFLIIYAISYCIINIFSKVDSIEVKENNNIFLAN